MQRVEVFSDDFSTSDNCKFGRVSVDNEPSKTPSLFCHTPTRARAHMHTRSRASKHADDWIERIVAADAVELDKKEKKKH